MLADFRAFLETQKIAATDGDLQGNREAVSRQILEEVLRQVFGEAEARKRSVKWDPQVLKALELAPKAELLLRDPQRFVAERQREGRPVSIAQRLGAREGN